MNRQATKQAQPIQTAPLASGVLQRKCDCGNHTIAGGECNECGRSRLQRRSSGQAKPTEVPQIVHEVLRSPGQPLDAATRDFFGSRFGHDFSRVRLHIGGQAAESARSVGALAYTVGRDVVFGAGQYSPGSVAGRRLLAHELTHVMQQEGAVTATPQRLVEPLAGGAYRVAVAPGLANELDSSENRADAEADAVANRVVGMDSQAALGQQVQVGERVRPGIHRVRVPLSSPVPLCGRTLTHIDIEPPRTRPLVPCTTQPVTRINLVGRQVTSATTGMGRMIFNLHIGYFRDPTTGRLCVVADDSLTCVAPRCLMLGCFPTMSEVIDAIWEFLKKAFTALLLLAIAVILFFLLRGMRLSPGQGLPAPALAGAGGGREGEGGGEGEGAGEGATAEV